MFLAWPLVPRVLLSCGGGLAVDKIKFFVLFLLVAFGVQHVQIQQERENWRKFCIQLEADKAYAILPLALAPAAPYVLASLVAGTTAVWCYTHGGKEAWIQFTGAVNDGVDVTKAWIQEKIATNNGVDTTGTYNSIYCMNTQDQEFPLIPPSWFYTGQYVADGSSTYKLTSKIGQAYLVRTEPIFFSTGYIYIKTSYRRAPPYQNEIMYVIFNYNNVTNDPTNPPLYNTNFDPADYPELYTGPALLSNCHQVAKQYPNLSLVYPPPTATAPSSYDPTKKIEVPIAARLADGSLVDQSGRKLPLPPPGIVPGLIDPPILAPDTPTIPIETPAADLPNYVNPEIGEDLKDFFAPVDLSNQLGQLGITGPINGIRDIGGTKHLVWKDAQGITRVTPVSAAVAAQVAPMLPAAAVQTGTGTMVKPGEAEADPGNPADTALPAVPTFDTDWAWGDMLEWDWSSWIAKIPFLSVLSGASIQLTGASSEINFPITVYDQSKIVSFDFADYEMIWQAMGIVIYAVACWWGLQLALLKNG